MPPTEDTDDLRQKLTHAEAVIVELRGVVADLRRQIDAQQAHIHRLVKMTFGRSSERANGPTLFDGVDPELDPTPTIVVDAVPESEAPTPKRKGHGRRAKPTDLPRRPEVIDLSDAEKVCRCCGAAKVRIGQTVNERLDYQPMAIFVRELIRPVYAYRSCESQGHDPRIAKAVLPPEPIPKSNVQAGLLAHVIVSKFCDHLPLNRQEAILARHGWDVRRSTLCDHLQKCGQLLKPLYELMRQRLLQSFAIHADDTPLLLLRPRRTAFAWVYLGDTANTPCSTSPPAGVRRSLKRSSPATGVSSTPTPTMGTTPCIRTSDTSVAGCTPVGTSWRPSRATRGRSRPLPSSVPFTPSRRN
jgi:transposase